eukprot:749681-Rhodomonas_salina.5
MTRTLIDEVTRRRDKEKKHQAETSTADAASTADASTPGQQCWVSRPGLPGKCRTRVSGIAGCTEQCHDRVRAEPHP